MVVRFLENGEVDIFDDDDDDDDDNDTRTLMTAAEAAADASATLKKCSRRIKHTTEMLRAIRKMF